jgi:hypothetical protein
MDHSKAIPLLAAAKRILALVETADSISKEDEEALRSAIIGYEEELRDPYQEQGDTAKIPEDEPKYRVSISGHTCHFEDGSDEITKGDVYSIDCTNAQEAHILKMIEALEDEPRIKMLYEREASSGGMIKVSRIPNH